MEEILVDNLSEVLNIGDEFTTDKGERMKVVGFKDGDVVAKCLDHPGKYKKGTSISSEYVSLPE